ncbi:pyoverdine biosynthesis regulatory gene SyrP-like protein [Legionella donaldsonii]|uniref:Pyoverdine biosynthesis regulatory gene SyrP-like protein n=1 Tax=Legionella donaldsonii TaxID=45060 RepID=A0A378IZE7_9GAMM|nr:TauD/TfdA family dioxygenase [Legionella donaldsonii]STX40478.1 pyoverdine biosynthesis regulatory gene SyrP-like protein [Legionella donaldsonii]
MANFDFTYTFLNREKLPLLIQPTSERQANVDTLIHFLNEENAFFKEQLLQYGAIRFHGFHVNSAEQFAAVISACSLGMLFNYDLCAVPRTKIQEGIYTSINIHESFSVPMHNEKSYDPEFPNYIFFNSLKTPGFGGNTPLADGHKIWLSLPDSLQQKLEAKGMLYRHFFYGKGLRQRFVRLIGKGLNCRTWMSAFQTEDKNELEKILHNLNLQFRWTSKGNGLITERALPACRRHPINNKVVWFNQAAHNNLYYNKSFVAINRTVKNPIARFILSHRNFLPYVVFYGDGEPISKEEADLMHFAIKKNIVSTSWQVGDLMVVDNYSCMHGKEPHKGERLLLAAMTK